MGIQSFSWTDVSYSVRSGQETKQLLRGITGQANAGEVIAIMGGSGAGKTTFLTFLAGRIGHGDMEGDVLIDGTPRQVSTWSTQSGYVEQDDVMHPHLTVLETLKFAAMLRLPPSMTHTEKMERVESTLMELGLDKCRDTLIGGPELRGISGGERKRVAIGVELLNRPNVLFLDEPTSGLDAFTALYVIKIIKDYASQHNMAVIMTLHQPRTQLLNLLDKVLILSTGRCVWFGSTSDALHHFESLGFPLPPHTNPSDHFLDIATVDTRSSDLLQESEQRIEIFAAAWEKRNSDSETLGSTLSVVVEDVNPAAAVKSRKMHSKAGWFADLQVLLNRDLKDQFRDKATLSATIANAFIVLMLWGFVWFRMGVNSAGVQNRIGAIFFISVNQVFGTMMPVVVLFPSQRPIVKRERAAGSYSASAAYISRLLSSIPLLYISLILLCVPGYWMIGFQANANNFFIYLLTVAVLTFTSLCLGACIGSAAPNFRMAALIVPLLTVLFVLFCGQMVNLDTVTPALRWIQYVSPIAWTQKALSQNEFSGLVFDCSVDDIGCIPTGETALAVYKLDGIGLWTCIGINFAMGVGLLLLGYYMYKRTTRPAIRLEAIRKHN